MLRAHKYLIGLFTLIMVSTLAIGNASFNVVSTPSSNVNYEQKEIKVTVKHGDGTTSQAYYDVGEEVYLPTLDGNSLYKTEITRSNSDTNKTVNDIEYYQQSFTIEDKVGASKVTDIVVDEVSTIPKSGAQTMAQYIESNSNPTIKIGGGGGFDPGVNGSNEAIDGKYVPFYTTTINKLVKFIVEDGSSSSYEDDSNYTNNPSTATATTAYQHVTSDNNIITLVLMQDLTITSGGTLVLEAINGINRNGCAGNVISGLYTALDLNGHNITVQSGGNIYSHGIIYDSKGTGSIQMESGSFLYSSFVVEDYGGGGITVGAYALGSSPFTLISMPYLNCDIYFYVGSNLIGMTELYTSKLEVLGQELGGYNRTTVNLIGATSDSLIQISQNGSGSNPYLLRSVEGEHSIDSSYSDYRKYLTYLTYDEIYQTNNLAVSINSLTLSLALGLNFDITMDSVHFPYSPWLNFKVINNSSFAFKQRVDMFPGSSFYCDSTSTVNFAEGAGVMTLNRMLQTGTYTINSLGNSSLYAEWDKILPIASIEIEGKLTAVGTTNNNTNTLGGNITIPEDSQYYSDNVTEITNKITDDWSVYYSGGTEPNDVISSALEILANNLSGVAKGAVNSYYIYPRSINNKVVSNTSCNFNYYDNTYSDGINTYFYRWSAKSGDTTNQMPSGSYQKASSVYTIDVNVQTSLNSEGDSVIEKMKYNLAVSGDDNQWYINFGGVFVEVADLSNFSIYLYDGDRTYSTPADEDYEQKYFNGDGDYFTGAYFENILYQSNGVYYVDAAGFRFDSNTSGQSAKSYKYKLQQSNYCSYTNGSVKESSWGPAGYKHNRTDTGSRTNENVRLFRFDTTLGQWRFTY